MIDATIAPLVAMESRDVMVIEEIDQDDEKIEEAGKPKKQEQPVVLDQ